MWLFCRLRSGFGLECYVTWYMGQNSSITYENAVQMGVTVVKGRLMQTAAVPAFSGCGSVLITDRQTCPWEQSFFFLPRFISPTQFVFTSFFNHVKLFFFLNFIFENFLMLSLPYFDASTSPLSLTVTNGRDKWDTRRQADRQTDR